MKVALYLFFGIFSLFGLCADTPPPPPTHLILVGGGDYYKPAIQKFASLAGGRSGKVLVITWATNSQSAAFARLQEAFKEHVGADGPLLEAGDVNLLMDQIEKASGVFFTGGDQTVLMNALKKDFRWIPALKQKFQDGFVFGGSSAGTAIMAERMPTGEGDLTTIMAGQIEMTPGLGLVPKILVDQHFIKRQRQNRMFSLLAEQKECFGLGVDEDNAVHIQNGRRVEVLGPGLVMTFDGCSQKNPQFVIKLLSPGTVFSLPTSR